MKVTEFAEKVAADEGGSKSISIAQVKEVLRIVNDMTQGLLYAIIKWLPCLTVTVALLMLALGGPVYAGGSHNHKCGASCVGPKGDKGDTGATGAAGAAGEQGASGLNGLNGAAGVDGRDGKDAETHTRVIAGVDVRLLDYEHLALHAFDDYNVRDGRNDAVGVRLAVKLGKSYEQRRIEELVVAGAAVTKLMYEELAKRDRAIAERDKVIADLKSVAHRPGVHQEYYYREFNDQMRLYDKQGAVRGGAKEPFRR